MLTTLLTINGVADFLQVKKSTIYQLTSKRQIPFIKIGSQLRFDLSTIELWIDEKRVASIGGQK